MSPTAASATETVRLDLDLELGEVGQLSPALVARINEVCDRVEDADDRAALKLSLRSAGQGGSRPWPGEVGVHLVNQWERAVRRLERSGAVVVAVAEGRCWGPAVELLLVADHRIARPDLQLALPTLGGHAWPGMVLHRIAHQAGAARARRLALFGAALSADSALDAGLVDEISALPHERAEELLAALGGAAGAELALRRSLLAEALTTDFEEALGTHLAACDRSLRKAADGSA